MASRSLLDLTPQSRCPAFFLQVLLGGLWSRSTRTPTHRRESILVVINNYIRFLEVAFMKSTISAKIIEALTPMFAWFGFPFSLRTDNGPQFVSEEFEAFLRTNGISTRNRHRCGLRPKVLWYRWISQGQEKSRRRCQKKFQERLKYLKILKYNLGISLIGRIPEREGLFRGRPHCKTA